jgi:hypothetical protein
MSLARFVCFPLGLGRLWPVALFIGALTLAGPQRAEAANHESFVYTRYVNNVFELWIADSTGQSRQLVASSDTIGHLPEHPSLSPDGQTIAYRGYNQVRTISSSGANDRSAFRPDDSESLGQSRPRFTPSGQSVVFSMWKSGPPADGDALDRTQQEAIVAVDLVSGELREILDWPGDQSQPVFTATGRLAFWSTHDASGQENPGIYVAAPHSTTGARVATGGLDPEPGPWFEVSADGSEILFTAWHQTPEAMYNGAQYDVFVVPTGGGIPVQRSHGPMGGQCGAFAPDGRIVYRSWLDGALMQSNDGAITTMIEAAAFPGCAKFAAHSGTYAPGDLTDRELLFKYAPTLRYDSQERFFADSAAVATNSPGNRLNASDGTTLFQPPQLSLRLLNWPSYSDGTTANTGDRIDMHNDTIDQDAQIGHSDPYTANRVYGRAYRDGTGKLWLQYWLWYYHNPQNVAGFGVHEGDWELVQIGFDPDSSPGRVTYAQHADEHDSCDWEYVQKSGISSPIVYVANASHASYFEPGTHTRSFPRPDDNSDGARAEEGALALKVISESGPSWNQWQGRWGGSDASPRSPAHQGTRWSDPAAFEQSASEICDAEASARAGKRRIVPGRARAERSGKRVATPAFTAKTSRANMHIRYTLPRGGARRVRTMLITVHRAGHRGAPSGSVIHVRRRTGRAKLPLPIRRGKRYLVRISAFDKRGRRSAIARMPVAR